MRRTQRKTSVLFLAFLVGPLLAPATAQDRQPLLGEVVDYAGTPVAGAAVTLVEDDPDLLGLDALDVLHTTSDARGRFAVQARAGSRYTALAVGPEAVERAAVARPVPDLACGRPARVALPLIGRRRTTKLPGLAAWGDVAALRAQIVFDRCPGHAIPVPIAADGTVVLPPALAAGALELRDANQAWLGQCLVPIDPHEPLEAAPRRTLDVIVLDDARNVVAGASVRVQQATSVHALPFGITTPQLTEGPAVTTDAQGRATVPFAAWGDPFEETPDHVVVLVDKEGFAEGASGWVHQMPFIGSRIVAKHMPGAILVTLRRLESQRIAVTGAGAPRTCALLAHTVVLAEQRGMTFRYFLPRRREITLDADGTAALPWHAELAGDVQLALPRIDHRRVVVPSTSDGTPPTFDRATCEPVTLRLATAAGMPARGAHILLAPRGATLNDVAHAAPLAADERGEVTALLPRGAWHVLAMHGTEWVASELTSWTAASPVALALAPKPSLRVRVVDRSGAPVAGVRFEPGTFRPGPAAGEGPDALVSHLGWNFFGAEVRQATTDAKGEATLHWLPWPMTTPTAFAFLERHDRRSADFAVAPADDVQVVTMPW